MTPEELDRTIEFIIEHQAQVAVHMEQLSAGFRTEQDRTLNMQSLLVIMTDLAQIQSRRLEQHEKTFQAIQAQHEQSLARLGRILDRRVIVERECQNGFHIDGTTVLRHCIARVSARSAETAFSSREDSASGLRSRERLWGIPRFFCWMRQQVRWTAHRRRKYSARLKS